MQDQHIVDVGSKAASIGGGAATLFFGLNAAETAAIVGAFVAVAGLIVQVIYTLDKRSRAVELHKLEVENLRAGTAVKQSRPSQDREDTP